MTLGKSDKVIKNTIYNNVGYFSQLLVSLFLTPFIVHQLGVEQFGVWVLIEVVVAYLSFLDLTGIGGAFVKYIAEYHVKEDFKSCNHLVNLGWFYYTSFWLVIALIVVVFKNPILDLFKFSPHLRDMASFVFIGILFISLIRGSSSVFRSVLLGLQRMDLTNMVAVVSSLVNAACVVFFLLFGFGLKGLVISGLITAVLTSFFQIVLAHKTLPQMRFRPFSLDRKIFRKTFHYGINIRIASISELVNLHVDKILLGYFLNTKLVGLYELGAKIAKIARSFPEQLLPAVLPASSEFHALDDKDRLQKLYHRGSKYLCLLAFPIAFFVVSNASLIMTFWLGEPGFKESALALQVLSIAYVLLLVASMGRLVARGMGIPQVEMRSSVLIMVMNIFLSIILIIKFGFSGALLGTSISAGLGSLYFMLSFHRRIKEPLFFILRKIYASLFFSCMISLFFSLLAGLIFKQIFPSLPTNRPQALYALLVNGAVFSGAYLLMLFKTGTIDKDDRELFSESLKLMKAGFRRKK